MAAVSEGNWSGEEKRKHKRVTLQVDVECRSGESIRNCWAENISISGMLIRTGNPFPQQEEIHLRFSIPPSDRVIECRGRVMHAVPEAFMGVEFIDVPAVGAETIEQHIAVAPAIQGKGKK